MTSREPELFGRFPALRSRVPWTPLGSFPTPARRLENLGARRGFSRLFVKRDDLSGVIYGGNKVRKLEFVLADARRRSADPVITFGALGSNHVLATTIYARRLGIRTVGILVPQPVQEYLRRNVRAGQAQGLRFEYVKSRAALLTRMLSVYARHRLSGSRPYLLWMGGSSTLGVLGYVEAGLELAVQVERGVIPEPRYAFVPAGTGGTAAGLMVGLRLAGLKTTAVAVRVIERELTNEHTVAFLARRTHGYLARIDPSIPEARFEAGDVVMLHGFAGSRYARFTRQGVRALELVRELEGLSLEGTYSAKAAAGMFHFLRSSVRTHTPVVFINTHNSAPLGPLTEGGAGPGALPDAIRACLDGPVADVEG
jgi:D-cysteine desulfhydrase